MKASIAQSVAKHQLNKNLQSAKDAAQGSLNMNSKDYSSNKVKARPSVLQQSSGPGGVRNRLDVKYDPEYRSIEIWNQKLESMLTVLSAADMTSKFVYSFWTSRLIGLYNFFFNYQKRSHLMNSSASSKKLESQASNSISKSNREDSFSTLRVDTTKIYLVSNSYV